MKKFTEIEKFNIEQRTFTLADGFSKDYDGATWSWNSEFGYFYLKNEADFRVLCPTNYYSDVMDSLTFSLGIACVIHNRLAWGYNEKGDNEAAAKYSESFYALRNHALDILNEKQASNLLRFLD